MVMRSKCQVPTLFWGLSPQLVLDKRIERVDSTSPVPVFGNLRCYCRKIIGHLIICKVLLACVNVEVEIEDAHGPGAEVSAYSCRHRHHSINKAPTSFYSLMDEQLWSKLNTKTLWYKMQCCMLLGVSFLASLALGAQPSAPKPIPAPMRDLPWGQLNFLATTDTHGWHGGHLQE